MKSSITSLAVAVLLADVAAAFPAALWDAMTPEHAGSNEVMREALTKRQALYFDPKLQYVSNQGQYAFVAPGPGDQRGPCPGLNAMANHNYLPHNGVATIPQFITQTNKVFGMGLDLATFLAVYGAAIDGNGASWSIGGASSALPATLGGVLSQPQGLDGSHNKYESDVSPTRGDLYQKGNNYLVQIDQFTQMYRQPLGPRGYDLTALTPFRAARFQQSIEQNPYFFNGPFSGVAVQPAAYTFIYRFMSNKSATYPEGYLNGEVLKSFFSVTGTPGNFTYTPGYERIPDNWYKRAIGDEYTIPFFQTDLMNAAAQYPQFLDIGGNTGTTNSFTGVDFQNFTGGVYNAQTLAKGNNAMCFVFQFLQQATPDVVKGLFGSLSDAGNQLASSLTNSTNALACPQLAKFDMTQFAQFPGYGSSYMGYAPAGNGL